MNTKQIIGCKKNDKRYITRILTLIISILLLILIAIVSVGFGSVKFELNEVWETILGRGSSAASAIIFKSRIPRAIISIVVGMNLAIAGALLQAVMRNPLADPGIIGVSSGAALASVILLLALPQHAGLLSLGAFIGGTLASFFVYILAYKRSFEPVRIVLAGIAVNAVLGAGISLLSLLYSDRIQSAMLWLNGSIAGKTWNQVRLLIPYSAAGLIAAFLSVNLANTLLLGDDTAKSLGVRLGTVRIFLCIVAAFLTGVSVATIGIIGFIGLIVPHVARLLVGSDYRFLLPASAVMGAILLLVADTVARSAFSPLELPAGIIMAIAGGPFFIYLMRKRRSYQL